VAEVPSDPLGMMLGYIVQLAEGTATDEMANNPAISQYSLHLSFVTVGRISNTDVSSLPGTSTCVSFTFNIRHSNHCIITR